LHCFLIGIILRFPVHQADRIVRGCKKGFGNCKWIFEAYASPLRTVEMISNPVEWVGEDVIANALPVSFVPDDVFEVIALPDTG